MGSCVHDTHVRPHKRFPAADQRRTKDGCPNKNSHRTQKSDDDDRPLRTTKRHGGSQVVLDARNGRRSSDRSLPRWSIDPLSLSPSPCRIPSRTRLNDTRAGSFRNSRPIGENGSEPTRESLSIPSVPRLTTTNRSLRRCERSILSSSDIASPFARILSLISRCNKRSWRTSWSYICNGISKSIFSFNNNYWGKE